VKKSLLSAAVIGAGLLTAAVSVQANCLTTADRMAAQTRRLQTELMVAALSCRTVPGRDFTGHYNTFVKKHNEHLLGNSKVLQAYFKQTFGPQHNRQMDSFVTALANDSSNRSMTQPGYCDDAAKLFTEVLAVDRRELEKFQATRFSADLPVNGACTSAASNERPTTVR
jgi:hypothetical protein